MNEPKKPPTSELEYGIRQEVEKELVNWVRGVTESNDQLARALIRLRLSYNALVAGESLNEAPEIMRQVEDALRTALMAKSLP